MKTVQIALAAPLLVAACAHSDPIPGGCLPPPADAPKQG